MSAKSREKFRGLNDEISIFKTAIALKCTDCQGYALVNGELPECFNCPLCQFRPKKGATKNKIFAGLIKKMKRAIEGEVVAGKDYWKNEFEKLKFSFKK